MTPGFYEWTEDMLDDSVEEGDTMDIETETSHTVIPKGDRQLLPFWPCLLKLEKRMEPSK